MAVVHGLGLEGSTNPATAADAGNPAQDAPDGRRRGWPRVGCGRLWRICSRYWQAANSSSSRVSLIGLLTTVASGPDYETAIARVTTRLPRADRPGEHSDTTWATAGRPHGLAQ